MKMNDEEPRIRSKSISLTYKLDWKTQKEVIGTVILVTIGVLLTFIGMVLWTSPIVKSYLGIIVGIIGLIMIFIAMETAE